jgi:hypothetical protein
VSTGFHLDFNGGPTELSRESPGELLLGDERAAGLCDGVVLPLFEGVLLPLPLPVLAIDPMIFFILLEKLLMLDVAVQVEPFESKSLKPGYHI